MPRYKEARDFIIFGSLVKGRYAPGDMDIALVMDKKDISLVGKIKGELNAKNLDVEVIKTEDVYQTRLGLALISEGFSIKNNCFLREKMGISPMKIYTYGIKHLTQTKKVLFGRGLNNVIEETKGIKLGAGSIMIPIGKSAQFEDFLDTWELKYKTKEYLVL